MSRYVLKFGGSSVATPERLQAVAQRVVPFVQRGHQVLVVVSAMGKTTDGLISLAGSVGIPERREMDQLLATGEQQSIALLSMALRTFGVQARSYTGARAGIRAGGNHMEGRIRHIHPQMIEEDMEEGIVPVVAGFQATNSQGDVITLGRGGSDLSAVALAAALESDACYIYTDVSGVFSADPRTVPQARKMPRVSFSVCAEMAMLGAKVLQARSVEMAARYNIPVLVLSSFENEEGTWVMREDVSEGLIVQAVVHDRNVAKVAVMGVPDQPGIAGELFSALGSAGIGVEMIIQSVMRGNVNDIAFLVKKEILGETLDLCRIFAQRVEAQGVQVDTEVARISVVGAGIAHHADVPSRMFSVLGKLGVNIDMIASTSLSITCVVAANRVEDAVRALHAHFVEDVPISAQE